MQREACSECREVLEEGIAPKVILAPRYGSAQSGYLDLCNLFFHRLELSDILPWLSY